MSVAFVLWSGDIGGAETWIISLSERLRLKGIQVGIVVVGRQGSLMPRLMASGVPCSFINLSRGAEVLKHARRFAKLVDTSGHDAAVLPAGGFLARALRLGGYRGKIIAIEHGALLQLPKLPLRKQAIRFLDLVSGLGCVDWQVVPSEFMATVMKRLPHRKPIQRVYPGVDPENFRGALRVSNERGPVVIGCAARFIPGKGVDILLSAARDIRCTGDWRLRIAGDGPEGPYLRAMAADFGIENRVEFVGWQARMNDFWEGCHIAVVPSCDWRESFGMVAVEAMASGLPVVAARNGGLPEIVVEDVTGALFDPGNAEALSDHLARYIDGWPLRESHGHAARQRVLSKFTIERCADEFHELVRRA